jgi:hypothetical protein
VPGGVHQTVLDRSVAEVRRRPVFKRRVRQDHLSRKGHLVKLVPHLFDEFIN